MPKGFGVKFDVKDYFFDREEVIKRIGRVNAKRLLRAGAFIGKRARTSIKRRKRSSPAGSPPFAHSTHPTRTLKNIQWWNIYASGEAVTVGPVKLPNSKSSWLDLRGNTAPALHEFGSDVLVTEERYRGSPFWFRRDNKFGASARKEYRTRRAHYAKRPFMGPALDAEVKAGTIAGLWSIGKVT